jgi:hypothetical protein
VKEPGGERKSAGSLFASIYFTPPRPINRCVFDRCAEAPGNPAPMGLIRNANMWWYYAQKLQYVAGFDLVIFFP